MGYLEGLSAAAGLGLVGTDGDTPDTPHPDGCETDPDTPTSGTLVGSPTKAPLVSDPSGLRGALGPRLVGLAQDSDPRSPTPRY